MKVSKTGKVTVKKGTPAGEYCIPVEVLAYATARYAGQAKGTYLMIEVK